MGKIKESVFVCISVLLTISTMAQSHSALIMDGVAIFYPNNFKAESHLPSFALKEEPKEIGTLPKDWKIAVNFATINKKSIATIEINENTSIYGTGEVTGPLKRNGTTRILYNTDNPAYKNHNGLRLYQSHPWVLGVNPDGSAFGVLADNTWKQEITVGERITFSSDAPPFRVIVIQKESPQLVLKALADLTGYMDLPPLWSLGYHQCRWSYYPDSRVREIADTFRIKKIPCDVIWMDIHYMDKYKIFTFSDEYFPAPKETNEYLHKKSFKSVWMIDPGVKLEKGYSIYESGSSINAWVKNNKNEDFVGKVWPGDCVFPDFTQKKVADWWSNLYLPYMAKGIDGVWNDMNEPAVFKTSNSTMPDDNIHLGDEKIKKDIHSRYHNVYGMLMVKASKKGILNAKPDKRPFVLSRSNFLGGQRYGATWTGDNSATWEYLKTSIPMGINLGLSGQPFSGPDVGGFFGNATPELYGNWIGLGTFYPFFRSHTAKGTNNQEPWAFGIKVEEISRMAIERRYRLLPYLYTQFYLASTTGIPVMQPLFFADSKNPKLRDEQEAFLFGADLLIIPSWANSPALPGKNWRNIALLPDEDDAYLPKIKIKPGAIVPLINPIQNTNEYSLDTLDIYVSLDESDSAKGIMYCDAGDGFGYKQGDYALVSFEATKKENEIQINSKIVEGGYKIDNRVLNVFLITNKGVLKGKGKLFSPITLTMK